MREDGRGCTRGVRLACPFSYTLPILTILRPYRDFNTRFSGITPELYSTSALQTLSEIRKLLDELISSETILIGHALENDLKTLRMIHLKNVDTAVVFQHPAGPPYRRALRDLYGDSLRASAGDPRGRII